MDQTKHLPFARSARPWLFLGLTLALTWLCGWTAVALQGALPQAAVYALAYAGGFAPLLVAAGLAWRHGRAYRRDFWRRIVDFRRIGPGWLAVTLLLLPALSTLAALLDVLQGGVGLTPEVAARLAAQPLLILPMFVWWFLFGPVVEEPGWRGYALDGLQARSGALVSTLVVGVAWAAWHLPLYFLAGTWQAETVGFATPMFWLVMGNILVGSLFYTWIYNNTARSTLAAILFHFSGNAFGELFALSARAELYNFALGVGCAALILLFWRGRTLTERRWGGADRRDDAGQAREPAMRAAWPVLPNGTG